MARIKYDKYLILGILIAISLTAELVPRQVDIGGEVKNDVHSELEFVELQA